MASWKRLFCDERLTMEDVSYLCQFLKTNLPLNQCLSLIMNKRNAKIIQTVRKRLDEGEQIEAVMKDHLPREIKAYVSALMTSLSFSRALSLSLEFVNDQQQERNGLLQALAYPCILLFITISALYLFDLYGIDAIFSLISSFGSEAQLYHDVRIMFRIMINVIYFGILFGTLTVILFMSPQRIVLLYAFVSRHFPDSLFNIYYSREFMSFFRICCDSGFHTKEALQLLKSMKSRPVISFLAFHLDESLMEGETMKEAIGSSYYDQTLTRFVRIANYTSDFSNVMASYVTFAGKRVRSRLKRYELTVQLVTYALIGVIVIFIYQILFIPMQAISIS